MAEVKTRKPQNIFEKLGIQVGRFVDIKNKEYNNSKDVSGEILKMLWGKKGVDIFEMWDFSLVTRILDKIVRLPYASNEQKKKAYSDLAGYALIGLEHYNHAKDVEDTEVDDIKECD